MLHRRSLSLIPRAFLHFSLLGALVLGASVVGCSAGDDPDGGDGSGNKSGTGGPQLGPVQPGTNNPGGGSGAVGPNGKSYCQDAEVNFVPQTPTVFVLVDRSTSMFPNYWDKLKEGVLQVIQSLQGDVRFGFGAYTGFEGEGSLFETQGTIAENNYAAIKSFYDQLGHPGKKSETPTAYAVQWATDLLLKDESPGDRFILLVSDGQPDYNDDIGNECGVDGLIGELQRSYEQGVRTLVFGIDGNIEKENFDYFAQAGWGEKPNWASGLGDEHNHPRARCSYSPNWKEHYDSFAAAGRNSIGQYSQVPGTQKAVLNADPLALAGQIRSAVEGLKSCTFDLGRSDVEVDLAQAHLGEIFVDGSRNPEPIPADQWEMLSPTILELKGEACENWQKPDVTEFFAGFPCEVLVVVR